jgi:hypothetical protein
MTITLEYRGMMIRKADADFCPTYAVRFRYVDQTVKGVFALLKDAKRAIDQFLSQQHPSFR